ncbi:hypothetical protein CLV24_11567 [Pontibacter ummariensis]|uniref:Uncharacterized protein n=1 Tax=Pontibacter ummariensis TaxID=1610492 RepID=A0A239HZZ9_9BACT|nr:hypothetical protein [Pontibacter ummariensis]PRY10150.1 hypothetical protein CLV24_11567 [Pontibacter ummariensis]SNS86960.1 hypothetical protein SAMN06296052_11567 [Pontibacter ummariensis]
MDRQDRNHYDRNDYEADYSGYRGYDRNDEHYHSARNLTNQFEQDYQRETGRWDNDRGSYGIRHTYHEGNMGNAYERLRGEREGGSGYSNYPRNDRGQNQPYADTYGRDRDRYRDARGDFWGGQDMDRRDWDQNVRSSRWQGYRTTGHPSTYDPYTRQNRDDYREQDAYAGDRGGYSNAYVGARFGGADAGYSNRNFEGYYSAGLDDSYGDQNYGGDHDYRNRRRGDLANDDLYERDRRSNTEDSWLDSDRRSEQFRQ